MTKHEARADIEHYLKAQDDTYFAERGSTREEVLSDEVIMDTLASEHLRCVNRFGVDRDYSVKDACDIEPGFYTDEALG